MKAECALAVPCVFGVRAVRGINLLKQVDVPLLITYAPIAAKVNGTEGRK